MSRGRKPTAKVYDSESINVVFVPIESSSGDSLARTKEAREIFYKMISLAKRKGRPRKETVDYEKAAA